MGDEDDIGKTMGQVRKALASFEREVAAANDCAPREASPGLLRRAQDDVEFLLGIGGTCVERSTFGAMLEQAELYAYALDDDGNLSPVPAKSPDCIPIKHQREEPEYEVDFGTMSKLGRGNRLLDAVGRKSLVLRLALEAYYGDRGERWGRPYSPDRSGGVGNREVSLYPLTPMGRKWCEALRARFPLSGELRADEVLANELATHRATPNDDMRRKRLAECAKQARDLMALAHAALGDVAVEQADTARSIRRTARRGAA